MKDGVSNGKRLVFESTVRVTFQNVFFSETHQNNIFFYFFKIIFSMSTNPKNIKNYLFFQNLPNY
jgi:hypothetical protein